MQVYRTIKKWGNRRIEWWYRNMGTISIIKLFLRT